MSPVELRPNFKINKKLVFGSASVEKIYRLAPGTRHESDSTLTIYPVEDTFGGSGLNNAIASARTRVLSEISFSTVCGSNNQGYPDREYASIAKFLESEGINFLPNFIQGQTEQSVIILSGEKNDSKRGFRPTDQAGQLLRDKFVVGSSDIELASKYPLVVASSFSPKEITNLAGGYKQARGHDNGLFIWTINKESAEKIKDSQDVQNNLRNIDVMFMSDREYQTINQDKTASHNLDKIDTIVVTMGAKGCFVRSHLNRSRFEYLIPSFEPLERVVNDNGAGEAHHNNFLATITTVHEALANNTDLALKMSVMETAARAGNLAAFIKIQQEHSLWYPALDFNLIREELLKGVRSPEEITNLAYSQFLDTKLI